MGGAFGVDCSELDSELAWSHDLDQRQGQSFYRSPETTDHAYHGVGAPPKLIRKGGSFANLPSEPPN